MSPAEFAPEGQPIEDAGVAHVTDAGTEEIAGHAEGITETNACLLPEPDALLGTRRSMVTMMQFKAQKEDYTTSLANLIEGSAEYDSALRKCHQRGAERVAKVVAQHQGVYVKAAQFIASLRGGAGDQGIPQEYVQALAHFSDHAPHKPVAELLPLLREALNLGEWPEGALDNSCQLQSLQKEPIASASLAQVHRAKLRDGTEVAIKVQYSNVATEIISDLFMFKTMSNELKQFSGGHDVTWIVEDLQANLSRELDFATEAANTRKTLEQLAHLSPNVFVPKVFPQLSSSKVLATEFCDGLLRADDKARLSNVGLDPLECASLLCNTFAEMIFIHGRVHADPHAGNVYFKAIVQDGKVTPQLVLLDHGLYHDLNEGGVRLRFCQFWQACCCRDPSVLKDAGEALAGKMQRFLPLLLSPWFAVSGSGVAFHEVVAAADNRLPVTVSMHDIIDFISTARGSGANFIGLLHTLGYVRGLLESLGFSEDQRLLSMLSFALLGNTKSPPAVPPSLPPRQRAWAQWRLTLLRMHILTVAPVARLAVACPSCNNSKRGVDAAGDVPAAQA